MDTTSATLLERLRQPEDKTAWARFVDLYTPFLYNWARRLGLQEPDAADLVQEVFLALLNSMSEFRYDPGKRFRSWLQKVAVNKWRDLCRRKAAALRQGNEEGLSGISTPDHAEVLWEADYRKHVVAKALETMKNEFQPASWKACWEVVVNGRSASKVAAELGLSPDAVYAAKYRILRRLRHELDGMLD